MGHFLERASLVELRNFQCGLSVVVVVAAARKVATRDLDLI